MKRLIIFAAIMVGATGMYAQRFAYVDSEYILSKVPAYQKAQEQLDKMAEDWRNQIDLKMQEVDGLFKAFQAEQVLLNEKMKEQRIQNIEQKEMDVKNLQRDKFGPKGELFTKRQELLKPIQDKIYQEVQNLAKVKGYDVVFDKAAGGNILFSSDRYDKSKDIIKALGY